MTDKVTQVLAVREAAEVQRCHTKRTIAPYTNGHHTYNALALLLLLYPGDPPMRLVRALMWHDSGERWAGDVNSVVTRRYPALRTAVKEAELDARDRFGLLDEPGMSPDDERWLHGVDLLEFYLWALQEVWLGNRRYEQDVGRVYSIFVNESEPYPAEVTAFAVAFDHRQLKD